MSDEKNEKLLREIKEDKKTYLLDNDSKRVIKINGVRLMVGLNRLTRDQVEKLNASPYFAKYFDSDEKDESIKDRLDWVRGFSPKDHRAKEINELPFGEAKKIVKEVLDIDFLKDLDVACKDAKLKDLIAEQMKAVLPSDKELK